MTSLELLNRARQIISDSEWHEGYDHRYDESTTFCKECRAHFYNRRGPKEHTHEPGCQLVETLAELDIQIEALEAKEQAEDPDAPEDPITHCSRTWGERMQTLEKELTAKAKAAEKRADAAEQRRDELIRAAREFGHADSRFRQILNQGSP